MSKITTLEQLREIYPPAKGRAADKVLARLDRHCRDFIALSPFLLISSSGAMGGDISPKGETPGFVRILSDDRLAIPDRPGNNRVDTMINILEDPRVGLLFLVPGVDEILRVNGTAEITVDPDLMASFEVGGRAPKSVLVINVQEAFLHCAKAIMRARLWDEDSKVERSVLPTLGEMLRDQTGFYDPTETQEVMEQRFREVLY